MSLEAVSGSSDQAHFERRRLAPSLYGFSSFRALSRHLIGEALRPVTLAQEEGVTDLEPCEGEEDLSLEATLQRQVLEQRFKVDIDPEVFADALAGKPVLPATKSMAEMESDFLRALEEDAAKSSVDEPKGLSEVTIDLNGVPVDSDPFKRISKENYRRFRPQIVKEVRASLRDPEKVAELLKKYPVGLSDSATESPEDSIEGNILMRAHLFPLDKTCRVSPKETDYLCFYSNAMKRLLRAHLKPEVLLYLLNECKIIDDPEGFKTEAGESHLDFLAAFCHWDLEKVKSFGVVNLEKYTCEQIQNVRYSTPEFVEFLGPNHRRYGLGNIREIMALGKEKIQILGADELLAYEGDFKALLACEPSLVKRLGFRCRNLTQGPLRRELNTWEEERLDLIEEETFIELTGPMAAQIGIVNLPVLKWLGPKALRALIGRGDKNGVYFEQWVTQLNRMNSEMRQVWGVRKDMIPGMHLSRLTLILDCGLPVMEVMGSDYILTAPQHILEALVQGSPELMEAYNSHKLKKRIAEVDEANMIKIEECHARVSEWMSIPVPVAKALGLDHCNLLTEETIFALEEWSEEKTRLFGHRLIQVLPDGILQVIGAWDMKRIHYFTGGSPHVLMQWCKETKSPRKVLEVLQGFEDDVFFLIPVSTISRMSHDSLLACSGFNEELWSHIYSLGFEILLQSDPYKLEMLSKIPLEDLKRIPKIELLRVSTTRLSAYANILKAQSPEDVFVYGLDELRTMSDSELFRVQAVVMKVKSESGILDLPSYVGALVDANYDFDTLSVVGPQKVKPEPVIIEPTREPVEERFYAEPEKPKVWEKLQAFVQGLPSKLEDLLYGEERGAS